ncbi:TPA: NINE protein [Streptococcus agalactiae]|nr:NINE protein [Streptococcus agalactiae]
MYNNVNKLVYLLLTLFLGGLGAHKFYTGKIGTGFIYLLFSWSGIPSFIAFIEFLIALSKPTDSNGNFI